MGKPFGFDFIIVNESPTICGPESDLDLKVTALSQAIDLSGAAQFLYECILKQVLNL